MHNTGDSLFCKFSYF